MKPRVVITGLGFCTPLGCGVEPVWQALLTGQSGVGPITLFDATSLPVQIGGEVKCFDTAPLADAFPEAAAEKDRKVWLGLDAALRAWRDAGLAEADLEPALLSVGVSLEIFLIEEIAPLASAENLSVALAQWAVRRGQAGGAQVPLDRLARLLANRYGLRGGRSTNCSACAAGAQAIGEAFRRLQHGGASVALAGATDSTLNPLGLGGFSLLHILSTENQQPTRACRPFDATRQGTVLSEGAVFLTLETREHARDRGARIYAEIIGYGSSLDAYRVTDPEPSGRGAALSMIKAMSDAGLNASEIDGINAHGTGTPKNDVAETLALKQVLGPRAYAVPVTANKSMTGHMIATSGAFELAASALALAQGKMPPTINREQPDPQCDLDYVVEGWRRYEGRTVLSNSFGFGGQNATLILKRSE